MSEHFGISELLNIAIEDERTGAAFYDALAKKACNPKLREILADLASQERYHQKRFEEMHAALGVRKPVEQYPGEYMNYLQTLTGSRAFPDEQTALRLAGECLDDAAGLDLAARFERDTLMLMHELAGLAPDKDASIVRELIREEQAHLVALAQARASLT